MVSQAAFFRGVLSNGCWLCLKVSSLFKFRVCVKVEESMILIIGVHDVSPKSIIVESTGLSFCSPNHVFVRFRYHSLFYVDLSKTNTESPAKG